MESIHPSYVIIRKERTIFKKYHKKKVSNNLVEFRVLITSGRCEN